jgi:hypothetical protein
VDIARVNTAIDTLYRLRAAQHELDAKPEILAADLVRWAAVLAIAVEGTATSQNLMARGMQYKALIEGEEFQDRCKLAGYLTVGLWQAITDESEADLLASRFQSTHLDVPALLQSLPQPIEVNELYDRGHYRYCRLLGWDMDIAYDLHESIETTAYSIVEPDHRCIPGYAVTCWVRRLECMVYRVEGFEASATPCALQLCHDLRRVCAYFYKVAVHTAFTGLRGSFWIAASAGWDYGLDPTTRFVASPHACLEKHISDSIEVILIAAERLTEDLRATGCTSRTSSAPDSKPSSEVSIPPSQEDASSAHDVTLQETRTDANTETSGADDWHRFGELPPEEYLKDGLVGTQVEIALALKDAGILNHFRVKALKTRLVDGRLWGKKAGHEHSVHLKKDYRPAL